MGVQAGVSKHNNWAYIGVPFAVYARITAAASLNDMSRAAVATWILEDAFGMSHNWHRGPILSSTQPEYRDSQKEAWEHE